MEASSEEKVMSQPYPWLAIRDEKDRQWRIFFDISSNRYYTKFFPDMQNKIICTGSHGWLVLEDCNSEDCYLFNPSSTEKIQLPPMEFDYDVCILSTPPSDPNCHVLFIDNKEYNFWFCQLGDDKFIKQEFELDGRCIESATVFEGKIHCLATLNTLVTIDFMGTEVKITELMMEDIRLLPLEFYNKEKFLVESGGDLLLIHKMRYAMTMDEVYGFRVFRMDFVEKKWVKIKSIGEQTIFLSTSKAISCSAVELGIKRNSIYYVEAKDDRCLYLYVFDLEDHSISMSLPCPTISRFDSVLDWVMIQSL